MGNVWVRAGRLTQESRKCEQNVWRYKRVRNGAGAVLSSHAHISMGFRCTMRRFSGTYVKCQYPGIRTSPSARRHVQSRTSVPPVDTGPVPSPDVFASRPARIIFKVKVPSAASRVYYEYTESEQPAIPISRAG